MSIGSVRFAIGSVRDGSVRKSIRFGRFGSVDVLPVIGLGNLSSARLDLLLMCLVAYSLVDRSVGSFASWLVAFFVVSWSRLLVGLFSI